MHCVLIAQANNNQVLSMTIILYNNNRLYSLVRKGKTLGASGENFGFVSKQYCLGDTSQTFQHNVPGLQV